MTIAATRPRPAAHGRSGASRRSDRSVVHVSTHYPPHVGGAEHALAALATELVATHTRVEVLTSAVAAAGAPPRALERGVRVRRYRYLRLGTTPVFPGLLIGLLRQPRGTVVHVHGQHAFLTELSRLVCALRGFRLVVHVHRETGRATWLGALLPAYRRLVTGPTLRAADRVVTPGPELATVLVERHQLDPARVRVVPDTVDEELAALGAERAELRRTSASGRRARADAPLRVLYLGSLVTRKRVSRLIEAVGGCREPVELVVVGEGELREDLERAAREAELEVCFTGAVDRAGVAHWLRWAEVLVLPSDREGMPLSVLEAMAAGVPVLATDVEGTRDLVAGHGLLVEPTATALSAGLERLAADPALREDLATRGWRRAAHGSWAAAAARALTQEEDQMEAPRERWRRLDAADASWAGITYTRSLWGIASPDPDRLRRAVAIVLARSATLARDIDPVTLRWRPLSAAELVGRPHEVVVEGQTHATAEEADRAAYELPLGRLPFRVVVGPGYLVLRVTHAFGDEWSAVSLLNHLLRQAASDTPLDLPWTEVSPARRRLLTAWQLGRRPGAVLAALRERERLSGGPFEPARLHADRLRFRCTFVRSPDGFLSGLRASRAERGLQVSLAAVALTGLRRTIATHLDTPAPGAEVVYDVRRESSVSTRALGNWVAGVYVLTEDDDDPVAVSAALSGVRRRGLSLVAAAAARRRRGARAIEDRAVFAASAGLRLTLSYIPGHGPLSEVAFTADDAAYFGTNPPNGTHTLTLTCAEVGDRMHFGIMHYEDVWSPELVRRAVDAFIADPWGDRR